MRSPVRACVSSVWGGRGRRRASRSSARVGGTCGRASVSSRRQRACSAWAAVRAARSAQSGESVGPGTRFRRFFLAAGRFVGASDAGRFGADCVPPAASDTPSTNTSARSSENDPVSLPYQSLEDEIDTSVTVQTSLLNCPLFHAAFDLTLATRHWNLYTIGVRETNPECGLDDATIDRLSIQIDAFHDRAAGPYAFTVAHIDSITLW